MSGVRSSLRLPCCILEQDTFTSTKVLVIPRKRWPRPNMTEKLLTGTLNKNETRIIGNLNFSNLLKRIVNRFRRAGYSLDIMRQTACLVFNPIMVEGYAALFSCTAVVQVSDSMTASLRS